MGFNRFRTFFNETIDLINKLNFGLFVSKAAEEVLVMYKKKGKISSELKYIKTILPVQRLLGSFIKEPTIPWLWLQHQVILSQNVFMEFQILWQQIFLHNQENAGDCIFSMILRQNLVFAPVAMLMCIQEK